MNVNTIIIGKEEALQKLEAYKSVIQKKRVPEDDKLESLYRAVSKGARVLNLANAFKQTGLNEKGQPRLAIARADMKRVYCFPNPVISHRWNKALGSFGFGKNRQWNYLAKATNIILPTDTFHVSPMTQLVLYCDVPHIPPDVRPKFKLNNYHILFEVKEWKTYPVDPYLLRRIEGFLYVVEAEWELTELEAELLSSMNQS